MGKPFLQSLSLSYPGISIAFTLDTIIKQLHVNWNILITVI